MDTDVKYDNCHRMLYHPDFHPNQGTKWTDEEVEYLCKFSEHDGLELISLALGRTLTTVATKITKLRAKGEFDYYKHRNKYYWGE
ncbi:DNA-entry nuclease [Priestia megaterium]|uniref:DNA-entry nuclease n=1 Tax=Priestia megaterium TaxID=1404 RepID=UPI003D9728A6